MQKSPYIPYTIGFQSSIGVERRFARHGKTDMGCLSYIERVIFSIVPYIQDIAIQHFEYRSFLLCQGGKLLIAYP